MIAMCAGRLARRSPAELYFVFFFLNSYESNVVKCERFIVAFESIEWIPSQKLLEKTIMSAFSENSPHSKQKRHFRIT